MDTHKDFLYLYDTNGWGETRRVKVWPTETQGLYVNHHAYFRADFRDGRLEGAFLRWKTREEKGTKKPKTTKKPKIILRGDKGVLSITLSEEAMTILEKQSDKTAFLEAAIREKNLSVD